MPSPCACSGSLRFALKRDIERYIHSACGDKRPDIGSIAIIAAAPGLWAQVPYRISHHLLYRFQPRLAGKLLFAPVFVLSRAIALVVGVEMEPRAHIGPGLVISNGGGIVVGAVTMGEDCTISQAVTLGRSSTVEGPAMRDLPTIGDRVFVGPRAVVAGPVTLGDDVSVAGGSLVTRDIISGGTAVGVPAKVISKHSMALDQAHREQQVSS
jgi:serine O-acetyltransferase